MLTVVKVEDVWKSVPAAWAEQYKHYASDDRFADITRKLNALKDDELTGDRIEKIIGNDSWTRINCDECDRECNTVIRIGENTDYEARWVDVCSECLDLAVSTLRDAQTK